VGLLKPHPLFDSFQPSSNTKKGDFMKGTLRITKGKGKVVIFGNVYVYADGNLDVEIHDAVRIKLTGGAMATVIGPNPGYISLPSDHCPIMSAVRRATKK
jgi:hypothetical protein